MFKTLLLVFLVFFAVVVVHERVFVRKGFLARFAKVLLAVVLLVGSPAFETAFGPMEREILSDLVLNLVKIRQGLYFLKEGEDILFEVVEVSFVFVVLLFL